MADRYFATGRRKKSVARVELVSGTGVITINGKSIDEYFGLETLKAIVRQPLVLTKNEGKFEMINSSENVGFCGTEEEIQSIINDNNEVACIYVRRKSRLMLTP